MNIVEAAADRHPASYMRQQGWVLVALQNALFQLLHAPSLQDAVVATVRAGGDTDTNGAICGALLGAVHGREAIPEQWTRMIASCRPMVGHPGVHQPRPAMVLAYRCARVGRTPASRRRTRHGEQHRNRQHDHRGAGQSRYHCP